MSHPAALGPSFKGDSWTAWKAFLAAMNGLPMDEDQLAIFQHHTGRQTAPTAPFTEAALICGRRGGKSRILALIATYLAAYRDYIPHLAPGEVATIAILASDRRQARSIFRYVLGMIQSVPSLLKALGRATDEVIPLPALRVQIEIATASFRAARGYTYASVLCDEIAFWRSEESANPDEEILAAIRPGLATIPGAMLLLASSPYSKKGALYKTYRRHYGQDNARVLVWKGATQEMNPGIDPAIIAEAYEEDPLSAGSEYGAEFRDDISAFVSREVVEGCIEPGCFERAPADHKYHAFADPSGGSSDSFTLAITHREKDKTVLDCVREIKAPFSPDDATKQMAETIKAYGLTRVTGDKYAGMWPTDRFKAHGITYEPSEKPKVDLYRDALPLLNAKTAELLDLPVLMTQLCNLERRTARGGRDSIDHPPGQHDDIANAVAGALLLAATMRARIIVSDEALALSRSRWGSRAGNSYPSGGSMRPSAFPR